MKIYNTSLIKKGILLSLVLLSPEILAAENLNFNYTRADASGLDPRVSKLAKACHTLTDPLNINVQFGGMNTQNVRVVMTVYGSDSNKGYAVYTLPGGAGKAASGAVNRTTRKPDPDLVVPFGLSVQGEASLSVSQTSTTPVFATGYDDPFCFSLGTAQGGFPNSRGKPPLYSQPPYTPGYSRKQFDKYCWGTGENYRENPDNMEETYWPDYDGPTPAAIIECRDDKPWDECMGKYMFYRHKYTYDTGLTESKDEWKDLNPTTDAGINAQAIEYDFPIYREGSKYSMLNSGNYQLRINSRNITGLELKISQVTPGYQPSVNVFTWKRDNNSLNNNLAYQGVTQQLPLEPAGNIENDPYQTFYKNISQSYFRGTLVDDYALNQEYKDQINNTEPLSLPAKSPGDINLVNTDSLTFKIKMSSGTAGGNFQVTAYGQPLKFGPLYTGRNQVLSAMQVRNACY
ncbi:hypothetical protein D7O18_26000 [Salmonella enterica subsp. enterica serovar Muenchen]|nr:hypothetical protein [Salmonella enterica subsp. enterica serovar Muenchen]